MQMEFSFQEDEGYEELTEVIIDEIPIKGYSISKNGNVYSHWKQIRKNSNNGGFESCCDFNYKKLIKSRLNKNYLYVDICIENGIFEYQYRTKGSKQSITCSVHKLVIDSWKPFDNFIPEEINYKDYLSCPKSIQKILKSLFLVNHIDHNKLNNNLDNLERVTHKKNSRAAQQHYSKLNG